MKNFLMVLGLTFLVLATTSGCGGFYGRGAMGGYGTMGPGYGSMAGGAPMMGGVPMMGGTMAGGAPMMGMPVGTGSLPIGARGALSPYGGSVNMGTGYTNPELTMMAAARRADWMRASASVPVTPMPGAPTTPTPTPTTTPDASLESRVEAIEDQLLADHGVE